MATQQNDIKKTLAWLCIAIVLAAVSVVTIAMGLRPPQAPAPKAEPAQETPAADEDTASTAEEPEAEKDEARTAFVDTWAERIDAFDAGTPLEGYGRTFAEAAYEYGVDPRWSPAIARVESGSGAGCVYECNAWGWGQQSWPDWDTAIYAHVAGLAQGYGSTISYEAAASYNEENPDGWYEEVSASMAAIWPDDSL